MENGTVKKCKYCNGKVYPGGDICPECCKKKKLVHKLWLICQDIKKKTGKK